MLARPTRSASYLVLVHRPTLLLHAAFRPHLTTTPLRFAMTSPPSGCQRDFHPQAVEHARRTWFGVLLPKQKDLPPRGNTREHGWKLIEITITHYLRNKVQFISQQRFVNRQYKSRQYSDTRKQIEEIFSYTLFSFSHTNRKIIKDYVWPWISLG